MAQERSGPPAHIRVIGRTLNATIARAPWAWPVLRSPMRRFFDGLAPGWDERSQAGSVRHLQGLATAVTHVRPAPERILDLGTGTGEAALFLAREFPQASVRGVDISAEMIRGAQRKVGLDPDGRVAFRVADASALPFDDESFDLVNGLNVPPFFTEIDRVLRPGGHVILVASAGPATPFYTPHAVLARGFHKRGVEELAADRAGDATYWVGRKRG